MRDSLARWSLLLCCGTAVLADDRVFFKHPSADYYYYRDSISVTKNGVQVEYAVVPRRAQDFGGLEQMNVVCYLNRSRQMKSVGAIGFKGSGSQVALDPDVLPGGGRWSSVGTNSAYEALWKVVMAKAGLR